MALRVLVFDSGVGGLSVVDAMCAAGLAVDVDYIADNAWLPYGDKPDAALIERVPRLLAAATEAFTSDLVVIACNTASTIALDATRAALRVPVVGVVPPIKPAAAATKTGVIALLATPATIKRAYTEDLIARFAADRLVVKVGSTGLVAAAEAKLRGEDVPTSAIKDAASALFGGPRGNEVDVVALACTHFPLIIEELAACAPAHVRWLHSGPAIAARVAEVCGAAVGGRTRLRRAAFTDWRSAASSWEAFSVRGFSVAVGVSGASFSGFDPVPDVLSG